MKRKNIIVLFVLFLFQINGFSQPNADSFFSFFGQYKVGIAQSLNNNGFLEVPAEYAADMITSPDSISLSVTTFYTRDKNNIVDLYYDKNLSVKYLRLISYSNLDSLFENYTVAASALEGYEKMYSNESTVAFKKGNINIYVFKSEDSFTVEFGYRFLGTDYIELIEGE